METIKEITGYKIPLETTAQIVKFMQEMKLYEQLVTSVDFETPYPLVKENGKHRLHRPFVDKSTPMREIREFAWAIGLDVKLHAVYVDLLSIGDMTKVIVPRWEVFRGTALFPASSIILVHNHPAGDSDPSRADIEFTKDIIRGALWLSRPLTDHIVLGNNGYYSFNDDDDEKGLQSLYDWVDEEQSTKEMLVGQLKMKDKAIEARERRIKYITQQKDAEIEALKKQLEQLKNKRG